MIRWVIRTLCQQPHGVLKETLDTLEEVLLAMLLRNLEHLDIQAQECRDMEHRDIRADLDIQASKLTN